MLDVSSAGFTMPSALQMSSRQIVKTEEQEMSIGWPYDLKKHLSYFRDYQIKCHMLSFKPRFQALTWCRLRSG